MMLLMIEKNLRKRFLYKLMDEKEWWCDKAGKIIYEEAIACTTVI